MNKSEPPVTRALGQFFRSTTLHGFKYLCSRFYFDRVGWVICCCASACCAGMLCAVLWQRFLQVPALLQLHDTHANGPLPRHMPHVAVCPPVHSFSGSFLEQLNLNASKLSRLSETVARVFAGKPVAEEELYNLEENMVLTELMLKYSPACEDITINCRWQSVMVPCKYLFEKELSHSGVCCIMRPEKAYHKLLNASIRLTVQFEQTRTLELSLECSNETIFGCTFFTKYDGEPGVEKTILAPGHIYFAQLLFTSVPMRSAEQLLESNCISDKTYSKQMCLDNCAEKYCGCSDPLRSGDIIKQVNLPVCSIIQLECLRTYDDQENIACQCLPSCNKITGEISLESTTLNLETFVIDPIYHGLNSKSTVLHLRLNMPLSRIFTLNPTETWLTLLSSLGGVFNMFLGVGLFSALEIIFLLLVTLPAAFIK